MIGPTGAVKVMVATKPVDFRNYVERRIMRSPPQSANFVLPFQCVRALNPLSCSA